MCPLKRGCDVNLDARHREPERRRGKDHHRHQPRGRAGPTRKKTLLVDLDPQGNATLSYVDPQTFDIQLRRARRPDVTAEQAILSTQYDELDVIGARISLAKAEAKLIGEFDGHFRLKDKLAPVKDLYEYIVIDTPPTLGVLTVNALVAGSHLIVPIQSSYYALEGTDDLLDTYEKIRARPNPDLQFLGVVITCTTSGRTSPGTYATRSRRVRRQGLHDDDLQERAPGRESGLSAEHLLLCAELLRRHRVLQPIRGGDLPCLS